MTDILYAAKGSNLSTSDLYTVNSGTGAAASLGASGFAITGLAVDKSNGTLYGVTTGFSSAHPRSIITLDTTTGAGTYVAALSPVHPVADIGFDSGGQMYGWDQNSNPGRLCLINKTSGAITDTATAFPVSTGGGGFDLNASNVLYGVFVFTDTRLDTLNLTTGANTQIFAPLDDSALSVRFQRCSAASFGADGLLWGLYDNTHLGKLDVTTGVWANVGELIHGESSWDALAWSLTGGGDVTPPTRTSLAVSGNKVTIGYDEALQTSPGPSPSEFLVKVNGLTRAVLLAAVVDLPGPLVNYGVQLTLSSLVSPGDTVLVSYTG